MASSVTQSRINQRPMLIVTALAGAIFLHQQLSRCAQVILVGPELAFPAHKRGRLTTPASDTLRLAHDR